MTVKKPCALSVPDSAEIAREADKPSPIDGLFGDVKNSAATGAPVRRRRRKSSEEKAAPARAATAGAQLEASPIFDETPPVGRGRPGGDLSTGLVEGRCSRGAGQRAQSTVPGFPEAGPVGKSKTTTTQGGKGAPMQETRAARAGAFRSCDFQAETANQRKASERLSGRKQAQNEGRAVSEARDFSASISPANCFGQKLSLPPTNKMGVNGCRPSAASVQEVLVQTDQGPKWLTQRLPAAGECAIVDWCNFTYGSETHFQSARALWSEDFDEAQQIMVDEDVRLLMRQLFSLDIERKCDKGRNFYKHTYELQDGCGSVSVGGQRGTVLVMLTGTGCAMAAHGWESRLHDFLTNSATSRPRLTRVDLAHDDFEGAHLTVDAADTWEKAGQFWSGRGNWPTVEHKGNWRRPTGAGRTLNIGTRQSGKYCRVYEKGRAEGDKNSFWTRAEVEFKSADRVLPFDMLIQPSGYFIAAYPAFQHFDTCRQPERITVLRKNAKTNWDKAISITRRQFGRYIKQFAKVYDPADLIEMLSYKGPEANAVPKRLMLGDLAARRRELIDIKATRQKMFVRIAEGQLNSVIYAAGMAPPQLWQWNSLASCANAGSGSMRST